MILQVLFTDFFFVFDTPSKQICNTHTNLHTKLCIFRIVEILHISHRVLAVSYG